MNDNLNFNTNNLVADLVQTTTNSDKQTFRARLKIGTADDTLATINLILGLILLFVPPFFFLPIVTDWFETGKIYFITIFAGISLIVFCLRLFLNAKFKIVHTIIDANIILILLSLAVSSWLSTNRVNSFLAEPVQLFALGIMFFSLVNAFRKISQWNLAVKLLSYSLGLLSLITLMQISLTYLAKYTPALDFILDKYPLLAGLNPAGTIYSLVVVIGLALPVLGARANNALKDTGKGKFEPIALFLLCLLCFSVLMFVMYYNRPVFLDADTGRKVASGVIGQSYKSALLGVGPGNFAGAFNQFRGQEFNTTKYWNLGFLTSNNLFFYLLTIGGVALISAFAALAYRLAAAGKKRWTIVATFNIEKGFFLSAGLFLILGVFLPIPVTGLWFMFVTLALLMSWYHLEDIPFASQWQSDRKFHGLAIIALLLVTGTSVYWQTKFLIADNLYYRSLQAAAAKRGLETYNFQNRAIQIYPWKDYYHVSFSQTNLVLADSLAAQKELTDSQKQMVLQLVQQSINSARNAVAVGGNNSSNWQNLSAIYRNLVNFAQNSDEWALNTESEAIKRNPSDPRLQLEMGGIYLSLNNLQAAANFFANATQLKPDYANGHYNLAQVFKRLSMKDQALARLQVASQIVCLTNKNETDCNNIKKEISDLQNQTPQPTNTPAVAGAATENLPSENKTLENASKSALPNLPKAKTNPAAKVSSPSGEVNN